MQLLVRINPADRGVSLEFAEMVRGDDGEVSSIRVQQDRKVPPGEAQLYDAGNRYIKSINLRGQEHTGQQGGGREQRTRR